jgi:hypothetical protein
VRPWWCRCGGRWITSSLLRPSGEKPWLIYSVVCFRPCVRGWLGRVTNVEEVCWGVRYNSTCRLRAPDPVYWCKMLLTEGYTVSSFAGPYVPFLSYPWCCWASKEVTATLLFANGSKTQEPLAASQPCQLVGSHYRHDTGGKVGPLGELGSMG